MIDIPMYCPGCGEKLPDAELFLGNIQCVYCNRNYRVNSYKDGMGNTFCPKCGKKNKPSRFTCVNCEAEIWQFVEEIAKDEIAGYSINLSKRQINPVKPKTDEEILKIYQQYWLMAKNLHKHQNLVWGMAFVVMSIFVIIFIPVVNDLFEITSLVWINWGIPIAILFNVFLYLLPVAVIKEIESRKIASEHPKFDKFFISDQKKFFFVWPKPNPDEKTLNEFASVCDIPRIKSGRVIN
jgi:hypothetical protein